MGLLRSSSFLKVRCMWSAELFAAFAFASYPDIRTDAWHGVADIALIRGCLCCRVDDIEFLRGDLATEKMEEMSVSPTKSTIRDMIAVGHSWCDLDRCTGRLGTSFEAGQDSFTESLQAFF